MSYLISDLKTDLNGVLHGTTVNQVTGLDPLISRAARTFLNDLDPIETIRIAQLPTIFDSVYDYACPTDLKGDRVIDIRPQVNRMANDRFFQLYNEEFDRTKQLSPTQQKFTIQYNASVKTIRIEKGLIAATVLNGANDLTANGTWAAGSSASNLTLDTLNYVYGGGSLNFDVSAGGAGSTGYLENSTMTAVDLSELEDQGTLFAWAYIPDTSIITNFILRWGSSSANYWSVTTTTGFGGVAFQTGWNLLSFAWDGAAETGTPDSSAVDYLRFTVTYNGTAETDLRLNSITAQNGAIHEIEYYSKYLFRTSAGVFQETVTDDTNIVNLDTDSYNVFFSLVSLYCAQQVQGQNSAFDLKFFQEEYDKQRKRYTDKIKSQIINPQSSYYSMPPQRNITTVRYS